MAEENTNIPVALTDTDDTDDTVYALDKYLNAHATMTVEQILAAIQRAITTGEVSDEFTAFIEMIKEQNKGTGLKFWLGTTAEFNALESIDPDTVHLLTDSTNLAALDAAFTELKQQLTDGSFVVKKATNATNAEKAEKLANTEAIGSSTQPVYITAEGVPAECGDLSIKPASATVLGGIKIALKNNDTELWISTEGDIT